MFIYIYIYIKVDISLIPTKKLPTKQNYSSKDFQIVLSIYKKN